MNYKRILEIVLIVVMMMIFKKNPYLKKNKNIAFFLNFYI